MNDVIKNLQQSIRSIEQEGRSFYIVNAGRMNHGKSSLLNSLLDQEAFQTGDVRTTRQLSEAEFRPGVFLVDTPGLDAEESDDKVAFDAYQKADMIIFVHTPNVGEFHKSEIDNINRIRSLFPEKEYFWQHFCLALTFREALEQNDAARIEEKILRDIKEQCGGEGFPVFRVSNSRYKKGMAEGKQALVKNSGIVELREFLLDNLEIWQKEAEALNLARVNKLLDDERETWTAERKKQEESMSSHKKLLETRNRELLSLVDEVFAEIDERESELKKNLAG